MLAALALLGCAPKDDTYLAPEVDLDGDGFAAGALGDCDDDDDAIFPGATELCDELDNDCDGTIDVDAADGTVAWADGDGDGYGARAGVLLCGALPAGYAAADGDCDDRDDTTHPGAVEVCDDADNDCDGELNEGPPAERAYHLDADADGFGDPDAAVTACATPLGYVEDATDCDDAFATSHPGGTEVCDGSDNDCDGTVDDDAPDSRTWYTDADLDGYGVPEPTIVACDAPPGYASLPTDCDDADAGIHPVATEFCNAIDDDCDEEIDEGAVEEQRSYLDVDGDGHGDPDAAWDTCDPPAGYVVSGDDCDDADASVYGEAPEIDNLQDEDCDGLVDEDFVASGDLVISEVTRQPYVGGTFSNSDAQWFEVYNTSARTVDLSEWLVWRSSAVGTDLFHIDPADTLRVAPGDYLVFCKTDTYAAASTALSTLACDYLWGDPAESSTYAGDYRDNTFNLQRDEDTLGVNMGEATLIDEVHWTYTSTDGYWPRDATRSLSLDPASLDATDNDVLGNWCSCDDDATVRWYDASSLDEYGTPGAANYDCP